MLSAIVEHTEDAVVGKGLDGTITSWNPGAERMFGYQAREIVGRNVRTLLPPDLEQQELNILERITRGEIIGHFETLRKHRDGHLIDVSVTISPIRDTTGAVIGASKIARDITVAKRLEAEFRRHRETLEELVKARTAQITESAERLRDREKFITTVTDNLPGMVGYWDRELRCRFANETFADWFGRTPAQMAGMAMPAIFGEDIFESSRAAIEAVLAGAPQQYEQEIRKPNGELGHVSAHLIPDLKDGVVAGFFVFVTDVTQLKRTEAELRRSNDKLAEALAVAERSNLAKGHFLANMSHEIRTPMNGVTGMLEILGHTNLDRDQLRIIATIGSSAQSLLQVIDDILDFSKIEAGQLRIEAAAADPTEIIEGTARFFHGAAKAKGLALRCFVAPAVRGHYLIDRIRLRQILSNLISNAIKFTPCGSVTVTGEVVTEEAGSAHLRFVVADTGIGISPEAQALLFQPFTQADDSTARRFGGTGLGLSICLRLAGLMGGKIELHSVDGVGTEVTLSLPARPVADGAVVDHLSLRDVRVALITPDQTEQEFYGAYLAHWGAEVTVISTRSGLATPPDEPFTLILAPLPSMAEIRTAMKLPGAIPVGPPLRYVFYSYDDEPADRSPTNDVVVTTALSRARMITAVAVAAGRKSPEIEFVERLPILALNTAAPSRDRALRDGRLILLAEDHPVNREVIQRQLHLLGYAADVVETGAAALEALAVARYGLLLTDCGMPEMNGYELTRRIRMTETNGTRLPIIALTANALAGEDQRCFAAGMDDYLAKPAGMAMLRDRLERWLGRYTETATEPHATPDLPRATGGPDTEPALSLAVLAEYCGGDPSAIGESLKLFVDTLKIDRERLSAAIARNNVDDTQLFAHRMKGAARIVGGYRLATCGEAVERAALARDWGAVEHAMPRLLAATLEIDRMYEEIVGAQNVAPAPV